MESKKNSLFATGTALGIAAIILAQSAVGHQFEGIMPDGHEHTHREIYRPFEFLNESKFASTATFTSVRIARLYEVDNQE
jgi:hypothetical protein